MAIAKYILVKLQHEDMSGKYSKVFIQLQNDINITFNRTNIKSNL